MYRIIDTHAHLEEIDGLDAALERAREAGVVAVIAVGMDRQTNERALEVSERHPGFVYPALGLHPWGLETSKVDAALRSIEESVDRAVAIGEVGLDYWLKEARRDPRQKELQRETFSSVLALAKRYRKPVLVHARGSWRDSLEMVRQAGVERAVFHWFSGPMEVLDELLDSGYFISATPAAGYSQPHRQAVRRAPLSNLLLETDCPVEYQGHASEPADLPRVLRAVAKLEGLEEREVAEVTTANAARLFGLNL